MISILDSQNFTPKIVYLHIIFKKGKNKNTTFPNSTPGVDHDKAQITEEPRAFSGRGG